MGGDLGPITVGPNEIGPSIEANSGTLDGFLSQVFILIGAIAVLFVLIGAARYVISNGDSSQMQTAKNTILYAIVGLVIAVSAYAIVQFVSDSVIA